MTLFLVSLAAWILAVLLSLLFRAGVKAAARTLPLIVLSVIAMIGLSSNPLVPCVLMPLNIFLFGLCARYLFNESHAPVPLRTACIIGLALLMCISASFANL